MGKTLVEVTEAIRYSTKSELKLRIKATAAAQHISNKIELTHIPCMTEVSGDFQQKLVTAKIAQFTIFMI